MQSKNWSPTPEAPPWQVNEHTIGAKAKRRCRILLSRNSEDPVDGPPRALPRLPEKFHAQIFCRGSFFLRNFSAPSMGDRGRGGPALCCTAPPRLRQRFVLRIGHLQNFQRLRAPLGARLRSPRATLAETARIRHLIEINRALGRTSALSVRITCFPTV